MSAKQSIVDRITAEAESFNQVQGIGDLDAVLKKKIPINAPAAFVFRVRHTGGANKLGSNAVRQQLTIRYGIVVVTRHANDAAGEKTSNENDDLLDELEAALLGFTPTDNLHTYTPMTIVEGSLISLVGYHYWQEIYGTQRQARKT